MCLKSLSAFHELALVLFLFLFLPHLLIPISLALCHFSAFSLHPCEIYRAPFASQTHIEQLRKQQRLLRRQLCNMSRCFVLQAKHLICGEVLALTNNNSASCYVLHCATSFDIIPLEICVCSIMNTDCFAIGVIYRL